MVLKCLPLPVIADVDDLALVITKWKGRGLARGEGGGRGDEGGRGRGVEGRRG